MKIKMKVKHAVIILIGILLFIPLITFVIGPQTHLYIAKKQAEYGHPAAKEKLLRSLESRTIFDSQKWTIIRDFMLAYPTGSGFDVYIGPLLSEFSHRPGIFTREEKLPYLNMYVKKGPIDDDFASAAKQLAVYYESIGHHDKARGILQQAIKRTSGSNDSWVGQELQLEQVKMSIKHANYSGAEQLLQDMSQNGDPENDDLQATISLMKAEIKLHQGHVQDALKKVTKALTQYETKQKEEEEKDSEESDGMSEVYEQLLSMKEDLQNAIPQQGNIKNTVKGRIVYSNGTPVANAGVFLRANEDTGRSISKDERYQQITDEDGYFEFQGVLPGSYQITLGLDFDQIDGWTWPVDMDEWIDVGEKKTTTYDITLQKLIEIKSPVNQQQITDPSIHFAWEKVEGADYYQISLGADIDSGSVSTVFKSYITDNQINVPIEEIYDHPLGVIFPGDGLSTISPKSLLAFTNTNNRFSWTVEAYRADGELISRSNGYRLDEVTMGNLPFFYLKERNMTKADHLLLDKKLNKALAAYKSSYKKNPNDIHSLRMIVRLMNAESSSEHGTESKKGIPYLEAYAEKTNAPHAIFRLIEYYYEKQQWDAFHKWFDRYAAAVDDHLDGYDQGIYSSAIMKQGKIKEASERFKQVMELDKSHRFIGNWLAAELYGGKTFDHALAVAKEYPDRAVGEDKRDWLHMVEALKQESAADPRYRQELKDVLDLYFQNKDEKLSHWMKTTNKPAMKEFVEAVKEVW